MKEYNKRSRKSMTKVAALVLFLFAGIILMVCLESVAALAWPSGGLGGVWEDWWGTHTQGDPNYATNIPSQGCDDIHYPYFRSIGVVYTLHGSVQVPPVPYTLAANNSCGSSAMIKVTTPMSEGGDTLTNFVVEESLDTSQTSGTFDSGTLTDVSGVSRSVFAWNDVVFKVVGIGFSSTRAFELITEAGYNALVASAGLVEENLTTEGVICSGAVTTNCCDSSLDVCNEDLCNRCMADAARIGLLVTDSSYYRRINGCVRDGACAMEEEIPFEEEPIELNETNISRNPLDCWFVWHEERIDLGNHKIYNIDDEALFCVNGKLYSCGAGRNLYEKLTLKVNDGAVVENYTCDFSISKWIPFVVREEPEVFVAPEIIPEIPDEDKDKVRDTLDRCPGTPSYLVVNRRGCTMPVWAKFKNNPDTTNLDNIDLNEVKNLQFGSEYGTILFKESVSLVRLDGALDLDNNIIIEQGKIAIDIVSLPELNKPAVLTFRNITIAEPFVSVNMRKCPWCKILSYENNVLSVEVSHFSVYEVVDKAIYDRMLDFGALPAPVVKVCIPLWECDLWSACRESGNKIRTCIDANNCGNLSEKPNEIENCTFVKTCVPLWNCSEWSPDSCSAGKRMNRTRECIDENNCGINSNKPEESFECPYERSYKWIWILVILIIILIIIILYYLWKQGRLEGLIGKIKGFRKKKEEGGEKNQLNQRNQQNLPVQGYPARPPFRRSSF